MLTNRLYKHFEHLENLCNLIGATAFTFNKTTLQFSVNPRQQQKLNRNYNLTILWLVITWFIIHQHHKSGDFDNFNQGMAFGLVLLLVTAGLSITRWYTHDLCKMINGCINFLYFMHRKLYTTPLIFIWILIFTLVS